MGTEIRRADYFVVEQHFRRYSGATFNNPQPAWFFFAALPLLSLPLSAALPSALREAVAALKGRGTDGRSSEAAFRLWWLLAVLLFFSLPRSKLIGYVLPALPPLVLLMRPVWQRWLGQRAGRVGIGSAALLCLALVAGLASNGPRDHADIAAALMRERAEGELVIYLGEPFFDLRLQARLRAPPVVVEDWDSPRVALEDNWRKELKDAGRFSPAVAAGVLWTPARWAAERCRGGLWWVVQVPGGGGSSGGAGLGPGTLVLRGRRGELHRVEGAASGGCP